MHARSVRQVASCSARQMTCSILLKDTPAIWTHDQLYAADAFWRHSTRRGVGRRPAVRRCERPIPARVGVIELRPAEPRRALLHGAGVRRDSGEVSGAPLGEEARVRLWRRGMSLALGENARGSQPPPVTSPDTQHGSRRGWPDHSVQRSAGRPPSRSSRSRRRRTSQRRRPWRRGRARSTGRWPPRCQRRGCRGRATTTRAYRRAALKR